MTFVPTQRDFQHEWKLDAVILHSRFVSLPKPAPSTSHPDWFYYNNTQRWENIGYECWQSYRDWALAQETQPKKKDLIEIFGKPNCRIEAAYGWAGSIKGFTVCLWWEAHEGLKLEVSQHAGAVESASLVCRMAQFLRDEPVGCCNQCGKFSWCDVCAFCMGDIV
jgi:hypothetical protein